MKFRLIGKWLLYRLGITAGIVGTHFVPVDWHLPYNVAVNVLWVWLL